jgi:hypothetical protein
MRKTDAPGARAAGVVIGQEYSTPACYTVHEPMKGRWILPFFLLISAAAARAVDFPAPPGVKTVILTYSSYSWDNAKGWVQLPKTKVIRESFGPDGLILSREILYGEDVLIEITRYEYSEKGHRKTTFSGKNEIIRTAVVEKIPEGTRETIYAASGAVAAVFETGMDPRGLPLRSVSRDANARRSPTPIPTDPWHSAPHSLTTNGTHPEIGCCARKPRVMRTSGNGPRTSCEGAWRPRNEKARRGDPRDYLRLPPLRLVRGNEDIPRRAVG